MTELEKIIEKYEIEKNEKYDLKISQMQELYDKYGNDLFEMVVNVYKVGFVQGPNCERDGLK